MKSISKFSAESGVPVQTLRYYDKIKLLQPSNIGQYNSYRYYSNTDLKKANLIFKFKKMGFTLSEIRELFQNYDKKKIISRIETLQKENSNNSKIIKILKKISNTASNKEEFFKELLSPINYNERSEINMKEEYIIATKLLNECYELFVKNDIENCIIKIEELKNKIFITDEVSDPFWNQSAGNLFSGIVFEIFKNNEKNEINFLNIFYFKINGTKLIDDFHDYVNKLDSESYSYLCLSSINSSPIETKMSIISVFKQKMKTISMFETKK